ncbi:DUF421 domain-containing protein [Halanaerobacter jeridensis]|uniref:Uncharacterized membrane protein YcaP (DUF421 family) n=1 Tax=Halanaerobacter jeridensis TaxID=706427 RepID=A0A938XTB5_9FIRM|nr:DUF421 domain-containing protein [Halanaerobacter jeridensis]MBM7556504.1 uncharacterized membrane protein YcaP (DUF421 family) [Halanaerobacter jeridensis]
MDMFFRTLLIYGMILIGMRLMGKREVGELTPIDLVVSLMIAELGVLIIEDKSIGLVKGLIPIFTLVGVEILVSYLSLKNDTIRKLVNGTPSVLIKNGKIMTEEMRHNRYTTHDLLTQLREKDIFNISDVEFAVLETSGELTVVPKSQKRNLTPENLGLETGYEGLPIVLIEDGGINYTALEEVDLDKKWLTTELKKRMIDDISEVLILAIETDGNLYLSTK